MPPPDKKPLKLATMEYHKPPRNTPSNQRSKPQPLEMMPPLKKPQQREKLMVKPSEMPPKLSKNNKIDKTLCPTEKNGPLVCQVTLLMEITKPQFSKTPLFMLKRNEELSPYFNI